MMKLIKDNLAESGIALCVALVALFYFTAGYNSTTEQTVVECPWGTAEVISDNGMFIRPFCRTEAYNRVITTELAGNGVKVRYKDGGKGTVDGVVRVALPTSEPLMLKLHAAVRDDQGLRDKLISPEVRQALNLTAGLMTSEEAYAEKRADFANWATEQIERGIYKTAKSKETGEVGIAYAADGVTPLHNRSPFSEYGIDVSGFQITDWDFEDATEQQINQKREAEMAQITAKENAQRAIQETIMVEEQGKKAVAEEKYRQMQIAQVAITEAEREAEVAVIEAQKVKDVNTLAFEAAQIDVKTAEEEKIARKKRADGVAYEKREIMKADNALKEKLEAEIKIQAVWADAYAKRAVPQTVFGGLDGSQMAGGEFGAQQFMNIMTMDAAKRLNYQRESSK